MPTRKSALGELMKVFCPKALQPPADVILCTPDINIPRIPLPAQRVFAAG